MADIIRGQRMDGALDELSGGLGRLAMGHDLSGEWPAASPPTAKCLTLTSPASPTPAPRTASSTFPTYSPSSTLSKAPPPAAPAVDSEPRLPQLRVFALIDRIAIASHGYRRKNSLRRRGPGHRTIENRPNTAVVDSPCNSCRIRAFLTRRADPLGRDRPDNAEDATR